jgi:uncharacterized LabA/DUF88 family protein
MRRQGVKVYTRNLRYRDKTIPLAGGASFTHRVAEEKGIDVRIAIDLIRMALKGEYDVALIFSQDQDLSEAVVEVKRIARETGKWIKLACAFPVSPTCKNRRGINETDWFEIDQNMYDRCIDPKDYREGL